MVLLMNPTAVEFYTWIGFGVCGCPMSIAEFFSGIASFAFSYAAPIFGSAAYTIIFLRFLPRRILLHSFLI